MQIGAARTHRVHRRPACSAFLGFLQRNSQISPSRAAANPPLPNLLAKKKKTGRCRTRHDCVQLQQASLVDHLDLFIDDLSGEAVDRHVHPVTLFAFRHAFEICSGGINTELCWIHIQTTDRT